MSTTPSRDSLTLTPPRITKVEFASILATAKSPAASEAGQVFEILTASGVDPSFALAQFRVESQYGKAGYAAITGSWGNMLYDSSLCVHAKPIDGRAAPYYKATNGYTYATYLNYKDAIADYCNYIHWYKDNYGLDTIYEATARWIGKVAGSKYHLNYVDIIVNDMISYEFKEGEFYETGDKMLVCVNDNFDTTTGRVKTKYPVKDGQELFRGTDGTSFKTLDLSTPTSLAWFIGDANGSTDWGSVFIRTVANPKGQWVYIKDIDPTKIVKVA